MTNPHSYNLTSHGAMIADPARTGAYAEAMRQTIAPDSVVVDVGCGTGIFSLLACRFGASKVYAIEPDDTIQLARQFAHDNGYADRITFLQQPSFQVELPECADVIVSDLRGVSPLFENHLPSLIDARRRFLAPGGRLIPQRDELWLAPMQAPADHARVSSPWQHNDLELDLSFAAPIVANQFQILTGDHRCELLAEPISWGTIDYAKVTEPNLQRQVCFEAKRSGTLHGLAVWFDASLVDGVGFSCHPKEPGLVYGHGFLPLLKPVPLGGGEQLEVTIGANLIQGQYVWRWQTMVTDASGCCLERFDQSSLKGQRLSLHALKKCSGDYKPKLDTAGEADRLAMELMNGDMTINEIAHELTVRHPDIFPDHAETLSKVSQLSLFRSE